MLSIGFPVGTDKGSVMTAAAAAFGKPRGFSGVSGEWDDLVFWLFNGIIFEEDGDYRALQDYYSVWSAQTEAGELWLMTVAPANALIVDGPIDGAMLHDHFKRKPPGKSIQGP